MTLFGSCPIISPTKEECNIWNFRFDHSQREISVVAHSPKRYRPQSLFSDVACLLISSAPHHQHQHKARVYPLAYHYSPSKVKHTPRALTIMLVRCIENQWNDGWMDACIGAAKWQRRNIFLGWSTSHFVSFLFFAFFFWYLSLFSRSCPTHRDDISSTLRRKPRRRRHNCFV